MRKAVTLDAGLLLLFVVGQTAPDLIARHKRLQGFALRDFRVLERLIVNASDLFNHEPHRVGR